MATEPLPVTGAWAPGDPTGNRKFFTFATDHPFAVESGVVLRDVALRAEEAPRRHRGQHLVVASHEMGDADHRRLALLGELPAMAGQAFIGIQ